MNYVRIAKPETRGGSRPNTGRPPKEKKLIKTSIQIAPEIWDEVAQIARKEGRSRSEIAHEMIRRGLAKKAEADENEGEEKGELVEEG